MRPEKSACFDAMLPLAHVVGPDRLPFCYAKFPRKTWKRLK
jgi:hypothetical protein